MTPEEVPDDLVQTAIDTFEEIDRMAITRYHAFATVLAVVLPLHEQRVLGQVGAAPDHQADHTIKQEQLRQRDGDQPLPAPNSHPQIADLVIADIDRRRELGIQRYGTPLQPYNGRDALRDAYEELLDGACYLRQLMYERDHPVVAVGPGGSGDGHLQ